MNKYKVGNRWVDAKTMRKIRDERLAKEAEAKKTEELIVDVEITDVKVEDVKIGEVVKAVEKDIIEEEKVSEAEKVEEKEIIEEIKEEKPKFPGRWCEICGSKGVVHKKGCPLRK